MGTTRSADGENESEYKENESCRRQEQELQKENEGCR